MAEPTTGPTTEVAMRWGPNLVLPIDKDSDDGRRFTGSMEIGRFPLPFSYQEERREKHDNAVVVGRVLGAERRADGIWAWGDVFSPAEFSGRHADMIRSAINLLKKKVGQVSADAAAAAIRVGGRLMHTNGLLKGVTMVALPAFDDARVELTADDGEEGAWAPVAAAAQGMSFFNTVQVVGEDQIESCCACDGTCPLDSATLETVDVHVDSAVPDFYPLESDVERVSCSVTGDIGLPIAERGSAIDSSWDGGDAEQEIFRWANTGDGPDPNKLAKAYLYRDPSKDPKTKWAWKLPIARPVAGELRIIPAAVFSASTVVNGGRAKVDIPESELVTIRGKVEKLYRRMGVKPPGDRTNRRVVEKLSATDPKPCGCRGCDTFDCGEDACACCWTLNDDDSWSYEPTHPPAEKVTASVQHVEVCSRCDVAADTMMSEELVALNARLNQQIESVVAPVTEEGDHG